MNETMISMAMKGLIMIIELVILKQTEISPSDRKSFTDVLKEFQARMQVGIRTQREKFAHFNLQTSYYGYSINIYATEVFLFCFEYELLRLQQS